MARRSDHTREELYEMALSTAREIVAAEGLRGLTARRVAREIGYSIGTIYNIFENFDDLIIHLNATTLDRLYETATATPTEPDPGAALRAYARCYFGFTSKNQRLWTAVFEHQLPDGYERPDWYHQKVAQLLSLAEDALAPFFAPDEAERRNHNARVLWSALYGICSLAQSGSLRDDDSPTELVDTLIENFLGGLRRSHSDAAG